MAVNGDRVINKFKYALILVSTLLLQGCPPPQWMVKPDEPIFQNVSDSCIRAIAKDEKILGVIKLDNYEGSESIDSYWVETKIGIAGLVHDRSAPVGDRVKLYFGGNGNKAPEPYSSHGLKVINEVSKILYASCKNS